MRARAYAAALNAYTASALTSARTGTSATAAPIANANPWSESSALRGGLTKNATAPMKATLAPMITLPSRVRPGSRQSFAAAAPSQAAQTADTPTSRPARTWSNALASAKRVSEIIEYTQSVENT